MIVQKDSLEFLKEQQDFAFDINFSDPPYALGSEIIIKPDGKYDYKKAVDFMTKWEMPTGEYWESWFEQSFRTIKHGGYCIMFGMDRQLPMFQYYAIKAGFQVRQSMYWFFISSFPKSSDLSKNLDKSANAERTEIIGKGKTGGNHKNSHNFENNPNYAYSEFNITAPKTDLAKKYDGMKYSISPLKQTCETIMIFQKPYKTGSCMHDVLAYENGDETCGCFALNIDGARVASQEDLSKNYKSIRKSDDEMGERVGKMGFRQGKDSFCEAPSNIELGRYPSQTFCDSGAAEILDKQSGESKSPLIVKSGGKTFHGQNYDLRGESKFGFGDVGGCSKILHKCDYDKDEMDLFLYAPKVSKSERNAGCENFEEKGGGISNDSGRSFKTKCTNCEKEIRHDNKINSCECENPQEYYPKVYQKNNHPTLKPISLIYQVLKLFKNPNEQKIVYPFAGVQSEVIGGFKAGFTDYVGCELSAEYVDIGNARFDYWKDKSIDKKDRVANAPKEAIEKEKNNQINLF